MREREPPGFAGVLRVEDEKVKIENLDPEIKNPIDEGSAKCGKCGMQVSWENAGILYEYDKKTWIICRRCMERFRRYVWEEMLDVSSALKIEKE